MSDRITLAGLRAEGCHGVFDHEKRTAQTFVVDLVLHTDLMPAGHSDRLADTVDYAAAADLAYARITGPSVDLIEHLAESIAADCLTLDRVTSVEVTVHKPSAPITYSFADVTVTISRRRPAAVVIALGGNLGDRAATLRAAVADLTALAGLTVTAISPLIESDPVGGPDQPDYLNAVVLGSTTLPPADLLAALHRIEARHGRTREVRCGPRTLDLDLIQYGTPGTFDEVRSEDPELTLPHPRAEERAFVLYPWRFVAPDAALRVGDQVIRVDRHTETMDLSGVRPGPDWPGGVPHGDR